MKVCYFTFGCKVNQYETELLRRDFESHGDITVFEPSEAGLFMINTCTVTAESDRKLKKLIHRLKRENPSAIVALCGCYPQAYPKDAEAFSGADIAVGTANKMKLRELVGKYVENRGRAVEISVEKPLYPADEAVFGYSGKTRAILKIQDGCDRFCSYCIIPYARGRSRSKPLDAIEAEARRLVEAGHREIVAVGINLSDYGKGIGADLADAVGAISRSGVERIRLGSLEADEFGDGTVERLAEYRALCPHFHLSLQSGCDKTLREMRRKYDKERYFTLVKRLRELFPACAITTDIMVGFPGETDVDFAESLDTVKQIAFADAHVFPYSPREGTLAAKRADQVPQSIKDDRAAIMAEAVKISRREYLSSLVGSIQEVLFEREKSPDFHQGHSANYAVVKVRSFTGTLFREIKSVRITAVDGDSLIGEIVQR